MNKTFNELKRRIGQLQLTHGADVREAVDAWVPNDLLKREEAREVVKRIDPALAKERGEFNRLGTLG